MALRHTTRAPLAVRIEREQAKAQKLDERIGQLMSARADVEEKLAELLRLKNRLEAK